MNRNCLNYFVALVWIAFSVSPLMAASISIVEIKSRGFVQTNVPVSLILNDKLSLSDLAESEEPNAPRIPTQFKGGHLTVVLPHIAANDTKRFYLVPKKNCTSTLLRIVAGNETLSINQGAALRFQYAVGNGVLPGSHVPELFRRAGFIHPLRTAKGQVITDSYANNHLHHHGIWFAWTKTEFDGRQPDFWNMGQGKGLVRFTGLVDAWANAVTAGFEADYEYVDKTSRPEEIAMREHWIVSTYNTQPTQDSYIIDFVSTHLTDNKPLSLPKYHYGGLGFRGLESWNGQKNFSILTSEGATNRIAANGTRSRWCYMGGTTPQGMAGIVILCAPENYRFPQPIRIHPDEPFFCYAPSQLGDWVIQKSEPYVSRYRFIILDGSPNQQQIENWWRDFAFPPVASLVIKP